jgi:hypothetical protein
MTGRKGGTVKGAHHRSHERKGVRTAFARPRKGDRVAADAAERVEDNVAATPLCYLRRYRLGRHAIPPFLV